MKRKLLAWLLAAVMMFGLLPVSALAEGVRAIDLSGIIGLFVRSGGAEGTDTRNVDDWTQDGDGSENNPFILYSAVDFEFMHYMVSENGIPHGDKWYKLADNYDSNSVVTVSVGTSDFPFYGHFDGNGKTVRVNISDTSNQGTALFRYIADTAEIKDLTVVGTVTGGLHCSGLVGFVKMNGTVGPCRIENCTVNVDVNGSGSNQHIGGVVGHVLSSQLLIKDTAYTGTISTNGYAGGIVGWCDGGAKIIYDRVLFKGYNDANVFHPLGLRCNNVSISFHDLGSFYTVAGNNNIQSYAICGSNDKSVLVYRNTASNRFKPSVAGASFYMDKLSGSGSESSPYVLDLYYAPEDWLIFNEMVVSGMGYDDDYYCLNPNYSGENVITSMIGSPEHPFKGHFDGYGKTLKLDLGSSDYPLPMEDLAPFSVIEGASIKNLKTTGTIYTSAKYAAGVAAVTTGSNNEIINCVSGMTINSSVSGDGTHGGFIARAGYKSSNDGSVTIKGCVFNGCLLGSSTNSCAGFVGWRACSLTIEDCVCDPAQITIGASGSEIFARNNISNNSANNNRYYVYSSNTASLSGSNCKQLLKVGGGTNVTISPYGSTTDYNVSNIRKLSGSSGVIYNGNFYAASGETILITLSCSSVSPGYYVTYTVSPSGTLNNFNDHYTLLLPDFGVTISASSPAAANYTVHFDANGGTGSMSDMQFTGNTAQNLNANAFKRFGYKFMGWATSSTGSAIYADGASVSALSSTNGATVTLYAVWQDMFGMAGGANGSSTKPYLISSTEGWNFFCDCLEDTATYGGFSGKYVKLNNDVGSVTRMAGNDSYSFKGVFDGGSNTLTVNITSSTLSAAPFYSIDGATIKNLKVAGSVAGIRHSGGLVSRTNGTSVIQNCVVSTSVSINNDTQGYMGGIVGHGLSSILTISGCVFNGALTSTSNYVGGLVGWADNCTLRMTDCLFAGSVNAAANGFHPVFCHAGNTTVNYALNRVYYTVAPTITDATISYKFMGARAYSTSSAPSYIGSTGTNYGMVQAYANGVKFNNTYYCLANPSAFNKTGENAYHIYTSEGWGYFCDCLDNNFDYNRFSGMDIYLDANISVSRSAGYSYHDFCGRFHGQNKTITFTASGSAEYMAPFAYVSATKANPDDAANTPAYFGDLNVVCNITASGNNVSGLVGATWGEMSIVNCKVTGTITTSKQYAAGFLAQNNSGDLVTIEGCVSGVTIKSSFSGDGSDGGFIAVMNSSSTKATIKNSVFNGKIVTTNGTIKCGGFIGWYGAATVTVDNCVYAPAALASGEAYITDQSAAFVRWDATDTSHAPTITNCYYTQPLGTSEGKQTRTVSAGSGVTSLTVSPIGAAANSYANSGITVYASGRGVKCGSAFYYGNGDTVSLTLAHAPAAAYYEFTGYSVDAGTLTGSGNNYTLTVPDADVTVTADFTEISYTVVFNANGGTGNMPDQTFIVGVEQNLAANTFTRTGYSFIGWALSADGAVEYEDGESVRDLSTTAGDEVILYAVWQTDIFYLDQNGETVTVPGNGYTLLTSGMTTLTTGTYAVSGSFALENRITVSGDVLLVLMDNCDVEPKKGISVNEGNSLTIAAQSTSSSTMGLIQIWNYSMDSYYAAIGGDNGHSCGSITVYGGKLTVYGGYYAAGIGGGYNGSGGSIAIYGGEVYAVGGDHSAGIGGGQNGGFDSIVIAGGKVTSRTLFGAGENFTGTPGTISLGWTNADDYIDIRSSVNGSVSFSRLMKIEGETDYLADGSDVGDKKLVPYTDGYIVVFDANGGEGEMDSRFFAINASQDLTANAFTRTGYGFLGWAISPTGGVVYTDEQSIPNNSIQAGGIIHLYAVWQQDVFYLNQNGVAVTVPGNGYTLLTSGMTTLTTGIYAVSGELTVNTRITVSGSVTLILLDNCTFNANRGISVNVNNSLTIYAQSTSESTMGRLNAKLEGDNYADYDNAGIGGTGGSAGTITIVGGYLDVSGGYNGAGIGGGNGGSGGNITIYGGKVVAKSAFDGAGIGGGSGASGGTIIISGGSVSAESGRGAGIGGGKCGSGGYIAISGGSVNAYSIEGAGIGGGYNNNDSQSINITGGTVYAESYDGAGLGGGSGENNSTIDGFGDGGFITISGGTVTAVNTGKGAAIGGGWQAGFNEINILGGKVTADAQGYGSAIGYGYQNSYSDYSGYLTLSWSQPDDFIDIKGGVHCYSTSFNVMMRFHNGTEPIPDGTDVSNKKLVPYTGYIVVFHANGGTGEMADQTFAWDEAQNLAANAFTFEGETFSGWALSADGGVVYTDGQSVTNIGEQGKELHLYAKWGSFVYLDQNGSVTVPESSVTLLTSGTTELTTGIYAAKGNLTISSRITVTGDVVLVLMDNCKLCANEGITVNAGSGSVNSLTICAQTTDESRMGKLIIEGVTKKKAGIGSTEGEDCGIITICGGNLWVIGNDESAGIGGAKSGNAQAGITIYGGVIYAKGGTGGPGIGAGKIVNGAGGVCDNLNIYGGKITAQGGSNAPGIGGSSPENITVAIHGGVIEATGGSDSAGIGSGYRFGYYVVNGRAVNAGSNITITGGTVTANGNVTASGSAAAAIGGGYECGFKSISITGGRVTVNTHIGVGGSVILYPNRYSIDHYGTITLDWTNPEDYIEFAGPGKCSGYTTVVKPMGIESGEETGIVESGYYGLNLDSLANKKLVPAPYYTVVFHANDGTDNTSEQTIAAGHPTNLNVSGLVRTGYKYMGWALSADGALVYADGEEVNFNTEEGGTVDLYAVWQDMFGMAAGADGSNGHPYIISSAEGWDFFCDCLGDNERYNRFGGKTIRLDENISVSRPAGASAHDFCGTFNGNKKTLTFTYDDTGAEAASYVAPFSFVSTIGTGHLIKIIDLNVVCDITTHGQYTSGLIGSAWSNVYIENCTVSGIIKANAKYAAGFVADSHSAPMYILGCVSSVTINSSVINNDSNDGTHGGFIAACQPGVETHIENCVFNGKLITTNGTTNCAGFIGWNAGSTASMKKCVYAPAAAEDGETAITSGATFFRGNTPGTFTGCWYTDTLGSEQGYRARTVIAGDGVESLTVSPVGNANYSYNNSGIAAYGLCVKYNGVLYYGNGVSVGLTLSHYSPAEGYDFTGFSVDYGTLTQSGDAYILVMPDQDVTVTADFTEQTLTYIGKDGEITLHYDEYTLLTDTMTTLTTGTYAVSGELTVNSRITVSGDVTLVLMDGCTFNANRGISVNVNNSLTVYAQSTTESTMGRLNAKLDDWISDYNYNAGIGGTDGSAGTITVVGGYLDVKGGWLGAGIGGGRKGSGGNITISGGKVVAIGGAQSAGIGGGSGACGGTISISGGDIHAESESGAGIGGGFYGSGGNITVSGGSVHAYSYEGGAGIGGGKGGDNDRLTITGGEVYARGANGAGLGGGSADNDYWGDGGVINISGGTVTAVNTGRGAAIGGGYESGYNSIYISGGKVTADAYYSTGSAIGYGEACQYSNDYFTLSWSSPDDFIDIKGGVDVSVFFNKDMRYAGSTEVLQDEAYVSNKKLVPYIAYSVVFHANDGTDASETKNYLYGMDEKLDSLTSLGFTSGQAFLGWNTNAAGTGLAYPDEAAIVSIAGYQSGTVHLYAMWGAEGAPELSLVEVTLRPRVPEDEKFDLRFVFRIDLNRTKVRISGQWYNQENALYELSGMKAWYKKGAESEWLNSNFITISKIFSAESDHIIFTVVFKNVSDPQKMHYLAVKYDYGLIGGTSVTHQGIAVGSCADSALNHDDAEISEFPYVQLPQS